MNNESNNLNDLGINMDHTIFLLGQIINEATNLNPAQGEAIECFSNIALDYAVKARKIVLNNNL